jgi:hypothetical protein
MNDLYPFSKIDSFRRGTVPPCPLGPCEKTFENYYIFVLVAAGFGLRREILPLHEKSFEKPFKTEK